MKNKLLKRTEVIHFMSPGTFIPQTIFDGFHVSSDKNKNKTKYEIQENNN